MSDRLMSQESVYLGGISDEAAAKMGGTTELIVGDEAVSQDNPMPVIGSFVPVGTHGDGPDIASAVTLAAPEGATKIFMQALGQNVRFTVDGVTAPTASKGFQLAAGEKFYVEVGAGGAVKVIQEAATADFQYQWGK